MEIERKFLVRGDSWRKLSDGGVHYRQGYIIDGRGKTVRIRVCGEKGLITIKGPRIGISRTEFEYEIPYDDANELLNDFCEKPLIDKHRYTIFFEGIEWVVDEFHKENKGLVLAEVELTSEDQIVAIPEWAGNDVSTDSRFFNSRLVSKPFTTWK